MRKFIWVFLLLFSCVDIEELTRVDPSNIEKKLRYMKDSRTGLCFAFLNGGGIDSQTMTCVPCDSIPPCLFEK